MQQLDFKLNQIVIVRVLLMNNAHSKARLKRFAMGFFESKKKTGLIYFNYNLNFNYANYVSRNNQKLLPTE